MKAKLVKEVKDEMPLAFTRNSLSLWDLVHRVKAVKAKCTHYCRDTRARKGKDGQISGALLFVEIEV